MTKAEALRDLRAGTVVLVQHDYPYKDRVSTRTVARNPPWSESSDGNAWLVPVVRGCKGDPNMVFPDHTSYFSWRMSLSNPWEDLEIGPDHDDQS